MRLALIGDVHCAWGPADVAYFDGPPEPSQGLGQPYDAVLFTGDLPGLRHDRILAVAQEIGALRTPGFLVPGNHDGPSLGELVADIAKLSGTNLLLHRAMAWRLGRLAKALGSVELCGYSHHRLCATGEEPVGLIAVRPHSQGGHLNFHPYIRRRFGPSTLEESTALLCKVVDDCPHERLVFLGHNGPAGLGAAQDAMYGADHRVNGGDWGDVDYRAVVDYALSKGHRVLAVIAGHMHLRTKQRKLRPWLIERDETLYINPARVPRVFRASDGSIRRYHVRLSIAGTQVRAEQVNV